MYLISSPSLKATYSSGRWDSKCDYQLSQGEQGRRRLRSQLQEACGEEDRATNEGLQVFFSGFFPTNNFKLDFLQIEPSAHEILSPRPAQVLLLVYGA